MSAGFSHFSNSCICPHPLPQDIYINTTKTVSGDKRHSQKMTEAILAGNQHLERSGNSRYENDGASVRSYSSTVNLLKSKFRSSRGPKAGTAPEGNSNLQHKSQLKAQVRISL